MLDLHVCMYSLIGKGHISLKDHIGAKIGYREKNFDKFMSQAVFWTHAALASMQMQVANSSSIYQPFMQAVSSCSGSPGLMKQPK